MWVDYKYVNLISSRLPLFKIKSTRPFIANFRCVLCGDSQKNVYKARGYIIEKSGNYFYCCHNGCPTIKFSTFLKGFDSLLYKEYQLDLFGNNEEQIEHKSEQKNTKEYDRSIFKGLKKISQLQYDHPVKRYIEKRGIYTVFHRELFFCPKFFSFVNGLIPGKFKFEKDLPFIIIPFLDKFGKCFGFNARCLSNKTDMRYISIMLNEDYPKIYGLHKIKDNTTVYVTEGPFDSMFIPNSVAICGADINLKNLEEVLCRPRNKIVLIYDNEPRSHQIIKKIEKAISEGFKVCIWPSNIREKDINDMILSGMSPNVLLDTIKKNIYTDLEAKVKLSEWRKC